MSDLNSYTCRKLKPLEAGALVAEGSVTEVRGREVGADPTQSWRQAWGWCLLPQGQGLYASWALPMATLITGLHDKIVLSYILQMGKLRHGIHSLVGEHGVDIDPRKDCVISPIIFFNPYQPPLASEEFTRGSLECLGTRDGRSVAGAGYQ